MTKGFERFALRWLTIGGYALLLSPFIFASTVNQPFLFLKAIFLYVVVEAMLAVYIPLAIAYPQYRPSRTPVLLSFTILLGILLLTAILHNTWSLSLWSSWSRLLGLFTMLHFYALFLMLAGMAKQIRWQTYISVSFGVSVVTALVAFFQGVRPGSLFGNPTFFAAYLLPHIFLGAWLTYAYARDRKTFLTYACGTGIALNITAIFLTETRGAIFALVVGVLALCISFGISQKRKLPLIGASVIVLIGSVFFFTRNSTFWQVVPGISRFAGTSITELGATSRVQTLAIAWKGVKERPLLGWGWDTFRQVFDTYYTPELLRIDTSTESFDRPHNIFFDYALGSGVIGLLSFVSVLIAALYQVRKINESMLRAVLIGAILAYAVHNFFIFDTYGSYLMLAITLALIQSQQHSATSTTQAVRAQWVSWLCGALMAVVLLATYFLHYPLVAANNAEFWATTYAANGLSERALQSWDKALSLIVPYSGTVRKEYLDELKRLFSEGAVGSEIKQRAESALALIETEINNKPNSYELRTTAADAYIVFSSLDASYLEKAASHIKRSMELSPSRQHPYYLATKLEIARNNPDAAIRSIDQAIALDPSAGDPYFYKALTAFSVDRPTIALEALAQAKKFGRASRNGREDRLIGSYLSDAGMYDQALSYLESAITRDSNDLEAIFKKAWVLYLKGDRTAAHQQLAIFLTQVPNFKSTPQYLPFAQMFRDLEL